MILLSSFHILPFLINPETLNDLRFISILPILSKLRETIYSEIKEHLDQYDRIPAFQSGFRSGYICTTALLAITHELLTWVKRLR